MVKKGSILVLALLLSLPGCWHKKDKKAAPPKKKDKTAQVAQVDKPGEEFDIADITSFFDELDEFSKFGDHEFDLVDAGDADDDTLRKDEFAWAADDETKKLDTIYFAFDKHSVDDDQGDKIELSADKAKQLLAEAKADGFDAKIVVAGYACSSAGSKAYNAKISAQRAKDVADQLIDNGILSEDIEARGYGSTNLIVDGGTRDDQWQNRRVELDILYS